MGDCKKCKKCRGEQIKDLFDSYCNCGGEYSAKIRDGKIVYFCTKCKKEFNIGE
jgi:hypothetical protein